MHLMNTMANFYRTRDSLARKKNGYLLRGEEKMMCSRAETTCEMSFDEFKYAFPAATTTTTTTNGGAPSVRSMRPLP
jgi:hypothetical protein